MYIKRVYLKLLCYDMMMEYTYGNGKPEAGKDFNTLNQYDQ